MRRHPFHTTPTAARIALALAVSLTLSACGGGGKKEAKGDTASATTPDKVQGSVASYDLAVGPASRFMLGMFNQAKGPIG
jgi:hypothetical protein